MNKYYADKTEADNDIKMQQKSSKQRLKLDKYYVEAYFQKKCQGFPGGSVVKNVPANAGNTGSILYLGRSHRPHMLQSN